MKRTNPSRLKAGWILLAIAVTSAAAWGAPTAGNPSARFLLSSEGSGRATSYGESNKIVTVDGKTHVAWLDAIAEGFRVRVRTLDRTTGAWGPMVTVGEAQDNHGGPALLADSKGYLHIVYYPHHQPFRYRRSVRPNDASEWGPEIKFGESLSYPVILCGPDDTLILTARRYYLSHDQPNEMQLWRKPPGAAWERQGTILRSRMLRYAHFQESLAWGPDHRTIHLSCRIYETSPTKDEVPYPSSEIVRFWSDDNMKTFRSEVLGPVDPVEPRWMPNLERPTGHNKVPDEPGIIFIAGGAGTGLHDLVLNNRVWWQPRNP